MERKHFLLKIVDSCLATAKVSWNIKKVPPSTTDEFFSLLLTAEVFTECRRQIRRHICQQRFEKDIRVAGWEERQKGISNGKASDKVEIYPLSSDGLC